MIDAFWVQVLASTVTVAFTDTDIKQYFIMVVFVWNRLTGSVRRSPQALFVFVIIFMNWVQTAVSTPYDDSYTSLGQQT